MPVERKYATDQHMHGQQNQANLRTAVLLPFFKLVFVRHG
jgi:hypothetical protein